MVIPSETPMVLYCHANIPSFWQLALISFPRSSTVHNVSELPHAMLEALQKLVSIGE